MNKEYIEREAALNAMSKAQSDRTWSMDDSDVMEQMETNIEELPAADVAPVVHGEWRFWDGWRGNHDQRIEDATCSECGYVHPTVRRAHDDKSYKDVLARLANYCPDCGAYMDGGSIK